MLSDDDVKAASDLIWRLWQQDEALDALPDDLRPTTRAEGYAIQAQLDDRTAAPLFGWKIAATSAAGQAHIGVDGPLAGRLLGERVIEDGGTLALGASRMRVAEPEFAFRFGRTLFPQQAEFGVDQVLAAVASLHPAIEVPDSRYRDFASVGAPQLIADNACAHHFVLGAATDADWRDIDLVGHPVHGRVDGKFARAGAGANVLGDPRVALTWLVNELSGLGIPVEDGHVVTTGTCLQPLEIEAGDRVEADFGVLGRVGLTFA